ncbi:MAG: CDP-alcohol phosphatidyltransferase family protein [Deltaproteobacteria bacterium]|nr:CDP-alcohol phosphatidyltransferase family protein [Deltaproteobacteria bacterium]
MTASQEPSAWRIAIPASITLAGIGFGLLSLALAASNAYGSCLALIGAALCDMIDGRVARLTSARSKFGAELDNLADIVSFGIAPAWLVYRWSLAPPPHEGFHPWLLLAFAFVAAGAIRLARYATKLDDGPVKEFEGLAIPIAALIPVTLVMASHELSIEAIRQPNIMAASLAIPAILMVGRMPMPSYKRFPNRAGQLTFYGLITGGLTLLAFQLPGGATLFGFLVSYVIMSMLRAVMATPRREPA